MADVIVAVTMDSITRLERGSNGSWEAFRVVPDVDARCITADPLDRQRLYAGSESTGIYTSGDGGINWTRLSAQPSSTHIFSLAVSRLERKDGVGTLYAGTEPSALYRSDDGGSSWAELESLRRIPSAPTWSFPPRPWTSHVRHIELSPHDPKLILVGIELGGVMRSSDGGVTWRDHPEGAYKDCHAMAMHIKSPGLVYEAGAGGVAVSRDSGLMWAPDDKGITRRYVYSLALDPADPELAYVGASVDASHAHYRQGDALAVIYVKRPDGVWRPADDALPHPLAYFPYALATHPDAPDAPDALYVGFGNGTIAVAADRGTRWDWPNITGDKPKQIQAMVVL